ncbi:MAG: DUF4491 family protein [Chloroflexota bacterium]
MSAFGPLLGLSTLCLIGLGFVWVIRGERYFGFLWWPYVMAAGLACILASLFLSSDWASALLGGLGASLLWGATELKTQAVRAELGWYPYRERKFRPPFADFISKWKAPTL